MKNIHKEYFKWLCDFIEHTGEYHKLLKILDDTAFEYSIPMDANRADDGINLRYRFGDEQGYSETQIASYLDLRPCSVLEMMVALTVRCEKNIMDNPDIGDRTGFWFWNMISNLHLDHYKDKYFREDEVDDIIHRFLNRDYKRNGDGGLFTVEKRRCDMRNVEIWYQMCWYLTENWRNETVALSTCE